MGHTASKPQPGVKLEVIGCGLSRTGTTSFTQALSILLGEPIYHGGSQLVAAGEAHMLAIINLYKHTPVKSDEDQKIVNTGLQHLLKGYRAVTDAPPAVFTEELVHLYPKAKVICTVRDPEKWWQSMAPIAAASDGRSTGRYLKRLWFAFILALIPGMRHWNTMSDAAAAGRYGELYYKNGHNKPHAGQYQLHMDYIKEVVPKDRLYFYNVKDGWEPLCAILDKPIPDVPFPHANDSQATAKVAEEVVRKGMYRWLLTGAVIVAAGLLMRNLF